ncbi:AAA domain-containing protein [Pontibacillus yanchengensis]|uniref:AAA domain-containing protein n=1 Tax=Pontibacillus yanchengensis TaxID=462910 RepID=A0ACC7VHK3_9BACI|nr:AAA family ATPase [Pontibacillus yanchengensis]MYL54187.1 AAA domain-containing protein [Pontibacillus yanchengensis]
MLEEENQVSMFDDEDNLEEQDSEMSVFFEEDEGPSNEDEAEFGDDELFSEHELQNVIMYSIKTGDPDTVENILDQNNPVEIVQLNRFKDELEEDTLVFIVLGGDKSKSHVTWETGLIGIGHIEDGPYDIGYSGNNFKVSINIDLLLDDNIKKDDLVPYKDTYNIPGISPMTKGEPNQALSKISGKQLLGLVRAILDYYPDSEEELEDIFGARFMFNVKERMTYLVEQTRNFEEQQEEKGNEVTTSNVGIYSPNVDNIKGSLLMDKAPIEYLKNYINIHKDIILTGPPGTGKTTIAERAASEGENTGYIGGYILSTATDDWSAFDTIGGYMPDPNQSGSLIFQEGLVLKSIRQNKWLIIDELNRADIDKAFGQMFTLLSGKEIELPFKLNGQPVRLKKHSGLTSYFDSTYSTYYIGQNWRIIATMNTFDKNSLFSFSYAFMRRFGFIEIPVPSKANYTALINSSNLLNEDNKEFVLNVIEKSPKPLGPALIIELMDYIELTNNTSRIEAVCGTIIPQYEGLDYKDIFNLYEGLFGSLSEEERKEFKRFVSDFFEVPLKGFEKIENRLSSEDDEDEE